MCMYMCVYVYDMHTMNKQMVKEKKMEIAMHRANLDMRRLWQRLHVQILGVCIEI